MSIVARPRAALGVKRRNVPGVLARALTMANAMLANAVMFASPTIALATFLALIAALSAAQQSRTGTRATGSATLRNTRRDAVWTAMESLQSYVQGLADALSAEGAASVIEAAGLLVAKVAAHQKALLTATLTTTPGVVHLDAYASLLLGPTGANKRVVFLWQMSDDGGTTWSDVGPTGYANTDVGGLALIRTYSFRVSVTIAEVAGPWSQAVSLLVH